MVVPFWPAAISAAASLGADATELTVVSLIVRRCTRSRSEMLETPEGMYPRGVAAVAAAATGDDGSSADMWRAATDVEREDGVTEAWSVWWVPEVV